MDASIYLNDPLVVKARKYGKRVHAETNHRYGDQPYEVHLGMVEGVAVDFLHLLEEPDRPVVLAGTWVHDAIEDARQSFNDVRRSTSDRVAEIAFAVTTEKGRTRKERANARYYEGIFRDALARFLKLCDRIANVENAKVTGSSMLEVYAAEQAHFRGALEIKDDPFLPMWERLERALSVEA